MNVSQKRIKGSEELATKEWTKLDGQTFFGHFVVFRAPFRLAVNPGTTYQRDGHPRLSEQGMTRRMSDTYSALARLHSPLSRHHIDPWTPVNE